MYSTNLTDAQWQIIEKIVELKNRKRKYSLRSIWDAILYVIKTGCQWRMLPSDFPKWQSVYFYYRKWIKDEIFDKVLDKLRSKARLKNGQSEKATLGIVDSQTVKWGNNRSLKSYDGNKKIKGIKRHIVVDKNGFLLAVMVTVAHIHDSQCLMMLMKVLKESFANIKCIMADGGYRGEVIKEVFKKFNYVIQVVLRKDNTKEPFKPVAKRWIVERTFAWFENDRRLNRNYELLMESAEEMTKIAAIKLLLKKF
jgi:transposase